MYAPGLALKKRHKKLGNAHIKRSDQKVLKTMAVTVTVTVTVLTLTNYKRLSKTKKKL